MPRWRAWRGSSMVMNDPKNSSRLDRHVEIDVDPLPGAEVQRALADLDHLGVAGDGPELLGPVAVGSIGFSTTPRVNGPSSRAWANQAMRSASGWCQNSASVKVSACDATVTPWWCGELPAR